MDNQWINLPAQKKEERVRNLEFKLERLTEYVERLERQLRAVENRKEDWRDATR